MKKIAITGATGLMGRSLMTTLSSYFHTLGTGFSRAAGDIHKLDLNNESAITAFLDTHQPDALIHAAAERKPDVCEQSPEQTLALNVQATQFLAQQCKLRNIRLIFISTDYVFDGTQAPYIENSATNPLNFYGQSKQQAEQAVLANSELHSVIRVPVLYGDVTYLAESAVTVIAEQISETQPSKHDHWAVRYPTHVEDIALTLKDLLKQPDNLGGIFHISNHQAMSKYDMACIIADHRNYPRSLLTPLPTPSQTAQRPYNCALKDTRLTKLGISHQRDFSTAIKYILSSQ
ncbi:NAD(P)-dependent oxidoreductase [Pseudoalteromonas citrea]|uniref:dTDP-4-dehydrorhamnose reductase n=1 Tax=Pseudoalteromonas citrea TaxID=43655 RepID=A0A5S3XMF8_9GAMM|nr:SDR family oxidoreductase [Pseudoalteromonas citrea]TMP43786.1 NAD(P)-dependent oxidoreductase [Pseudoalteromonas citrea]TMP55336.1 NAD(P)-dependent oxidoreductase [Pseudoalteromonas citrea]